MRYGPETVGLLKKSLYGTRDAPANWEAAIKEVMLTLSFIQAKSVGYMDATTRLSIGSRHGLGKVKHIDTVFLWAQDAVPSGKANLFKKSAQDMLADLFTKPLDAQRMKFLLTRPNYYFADGNTI